MMRKQGSLLVVLFAACVALLAACVPAPVPTTTTTTTSTTTTSTTTTEADDAVLDLREPVAARQVTLAEPPAGWYPG